MTKEKITETVKEYAAALFMLSLEEKKGQEFSDQLAIIGEALSENPEYTELLSNPAIAVSERLSALEAAFSASLSEYVMNFLRLLCENGRIGGFFDCRAEFERLLMEHRKASVARVTSVLPLTADELSGLRMKLEKLSGHSIRIENINDKSIIGGLVIEIDGKVIDGSVKGKLADVKEVISK